MSDTISSQFDTKNKDESSSIVSERRRWTSAGAAAAAMSSGGGSQMPAGGGAGGGGGYPSGTQTHHLPPTVPTPTQRLRLPHTAGGGPPAHQHSLPPPWRHSPAAATGLGSLAHTYFGSPHVGGLTAPGRGGMPQGAWQTAAKPAGAHSGGGVTTNPLFSLQSLQMMVTPDMPGSAVVPAPDYQQETMDLSSHSDQRRSPKKESLRNGGCVLSNGEVAAADLSASAESARPKPPSVDSVSVIAQNPLRESVPETDKILNCSSKNEMRSSEKTSEFATITCPEPHTDVDKASPLPSPASPEPAASAPPVIPPPSLVPAPQEKPPQPNRLEPDNVESILENMFRIQDDKPPQSAATSSCPVTPHSVIVSNDARTTHHDSTSSSSSSNSNSCLSKDSAPVCSPPEKINEQKLIEILKVEEPDRCQDESSLKESKEERKVVVDVKKEEEEEEKDIDEVSEKKLDVSSKTDCSSVKDEIVSVVESVDDKPKPAAVKVEETDDNTVVISESEDESNTRESAVNLEGGEGDVKEGGRKVKDEPDSMFIEVESELEKMFAGIVEPGSEGGTGESPVAVKGGVGDGEKKPDSNNKRRGRPKGALGGGRRSSDTSFSGADGTSKRKKGKEVDRKGATAAKKVRIDFGGGGDSQALARKGGRSSSNLAGSDAGKSRGPMVHVEGSRDNPTSVVVMNSSRAFDEDDASEKSGVAKAPFRKQRALFQQEAKTRGQGAGLYSSTLSLRYDSQTADSTWLCVLCKRGPHYEPCAGDLFGPYVVSLPACGSVSAAAGAHEPPCDYDLTQEQKRRASGGKQPVSASLRATGGSELFVQRSAKKQKRTVSMESDRMMSGVVGVVGAEGEYEVWVHEACAVWAPGVFMIGTRLIGLQDAVAAAIRTRCSECGEPGASVGCITRGCRQLLHVACARRANWHLDVNNFISKCSLHAPTTINTLHHATQFRR